MSRETMEVNTRMDARVFADFSHFNAFRFQRRWLGLAAFPLVMAGLGWINLITGSPLLFWLLLLSGLALPALYLVFYQVSLKRQVWANGLEEAPRQVYSVTLSREGCNVRNETEELALRWDQIYRVFVLKRYTYFYVTKARVFILPHRDIAEGTVEELLEIILTGLPNIRLFDKRGRRGGNGA